MKNVTPSTNVSVDFNNVQRIEGVDYTELDDDGVVTLDEVSDIPSSR
jgi:hypothetical protein